MRLGGFAFAVAIVVAGAFAAAGGCGLDPLQLPPDSPTGWQDASTVRRDSGGELTPEPGQDAGGPDAEADATTTPTPDAGNCPAPCTSCGADGSVCEIDCSNGNCSKTVNCPAGMPCRVVCEGAACANATINCASSQPCSLRCNQADACAKVTLNATFASKFCLQCNGPKSCSDVTSCNGGLNCSKACGLDNCPAGFGNVCSNCANVPSCDP